MNKIETQAWVLCDGQKSEAWETLFKKETISFDDISETEILVEPLFGGWEANMSHALDRKPLDLCRKRRESKVVLGNSGIVRVLKTGKKVTRIKEGDLCVFFAISHLNRNGCLDTYFAFGYDEPGSVGLLAKQTKVREEQLYLIPENSKVPLHQWSIISLRYITAWSNWKVAKGCLEIVLSRKECPSPHVFGWGGGVALGELLLAKEQGFKTAMIASTDERLEYIKNLGIMPIDRRRFPDLNYDLEKLKLDASYRKKYIASLKIFRDIVNEVTEQEGVSIFIDNIGLPVYSATLRVLGSPAIISTSGWKEGMNLDTIRALECLDRHIHVFTHAGRLSEGEEAIAHAEENNWLPQDNYPIYDWEDIPQLIHDYSDGKISSYYPTFQVNPI
ncbi:MAG: zinc-binding alcohol dehydrogenase family protein [Candidatus Aminicenantes bacterium]|nr:zinc-binding alcohol dehydrogenase family protein [Candidatus Aminicenantes bacterium]